MGNCVTREIAKSQSSQDIETVRARQAHFIEWAKTKHIVDPVGPQVGFQVVVAYYIKYVMLGENYMDKSGLRSATCKGYAQDVSKLFTLRGFPSPTDFSDKSNWTSILVHNLEREENIAKQRKPLDSKIFAEILKMSEEAGEDSVEALVLNVCAVGRTLGWRKSEHSQTKQDKIDYHVYPSGNKVMKSINGNDVEFRDVNDKPVLIKSNTNLTRLNEGDVVFRHQKNRQNKQRVGIKADKKNSKTCSCINLGQMVQRKRRLGHSMDLPLTVYKNKKGQIKYLTGTILTNMIRKAVKRAYPEISREELMLYSAHSIRVWACVLLHETGKLPDFIKKRLRWLGESYRVYLRDTEKTRSQHVEALSKSSQAVMDLIDSSIQDDMDDPIEEDVTEYDDGD